MGKKIREIISDALELPKDAFVKLPRIVLTGNREVFIESYKSIIEYTEEQIRLSTGEGAVKICGSRLNITGIGEEKMIIDGEIQSVEFQ